MNKLSNKYLISFVGKPLYEERTAFYDLKHIVHAKNFEEAKTKLKNQFIVFEIKCAEINGEYHGYLGCPSLNGAPVCRCGNTRLG